MNNKSWYELTTKDNVETIEKTEDLTKRMDVLIAKEIPFHVKLITSKLMITYKEDIQ